MKELWISGYLVHDWYGAVISMTRCAELHTKNILPPATLTFNDTRSQPEQPMSLEPFTLTNMWDISWPAWQWIRRVRQVSKVDERNDHEITPRKKVKRDKTYGTDVEEEPQQKK